MTSISSAAGRRKFQKTSEKLFFENFLKLKKHVWGSRILDKDHKAIMQVMFNNFNNNGTVVEGYISQTTIAEEASISDRTVRRKLPQLMKMGLVTMTARGHSKGAASEYTLTLKDIDSDGTIQDRNSRGEASDVDGHTSLPRGSTPNIQESSPRSQQEEDGREDLSWEDTETHAHGDVGGVSGDHRAVAQSRGAVDRGARDQGDTGSRNSGNGEEQASLQAYVLKGGELRGQPIEVLLDQTEKTQQWYATECRLDKEYVSKWLEEVDSHRAKKEAQKQKEQQEAQQKRDTVQKNTVALLLKATDSTDDSRTAAMGVMEQMSYEDRAVLGTKFCDDTECISYFNKWISDKRRDREHEQIAAYRALKHTWDTFPEKRDEILEEISKYPQFVEEQQKKVEAARKGYERSMSPETIEQQARRINWLMDNHPEVAENPVSACRDIKDVPEEFGTVIPADGFMLATMNKKVSIADDYGVTQKTISSINTGRCWSHVTL